MVPSESNKDLVPEGSTVEAGISRIVFGQLFKQGKTEYEEVGVKDLPPLPTGFMPFHDLVYHVSTDAVISGEHVIVFAVASANNQVEFNRIEILQLQEDEMSSSDKSWIPVTVVADGWNKEAFHFVSKATYDELLPDFPSRRIAAITRGLGIFALALSPENHAVRNEPFTRMELLATSVPESARKASKLRTLLSLRIMDHPPPKR
jgi:hypothetical protein